MIDFASILKKACLKKTSKRVAILDLFYKNSKPLSADEVFKNLKVEKIDIGTVYRTLQSFEKTGILKRVDLRKGSVHYELALNTHHHHIVCSDCGDVEDFKVSRENDIFKNAIKKSKKFVKMTDHSLEIFGICKRCIKEI